MTAERIVWMPSALSVRTDGPTAADAHDLVFSDPTVAAQVARAFEAEGFRRVSASEAQKQQEAE